jgi:hypothetical protein
MAKVKLPDAALRPLNIKNGLFEPLCGSEIDVFKVLTGRG